jgi:hypothetical protein
MKGLKEYHKTMNTIRRAWTADGKPRGNENISWVNYKKSQAQIQASFKEASTRK